MGRRIVITSGKGGVGKTTLTANLGLFIAKKGASVVLVDADIGLNNLDVVMGLENKVVYDLGDAVFGACRIKQALIKDNQAECLYLLASAKVNAEKIGARELSSVISQLCAMFDYVLIDCPAGIENGFHRAVSASSEAIIVTTPHISAVRDADKVRGILASYNITSLSLVVNRVRGDLVAKGSMIDANAIATLLKIPLAGVIPEDDDVTLSGVIDIDGKSRVHKAYDMLAGYVVGSSNEVFDPQKGYRRFSLFNKRR